MSSETFYQNPDEWPVVRFDKPQREGIRKEGAFELVSDFLPGGDQPEAIAELVHGLEQGRRDQVLLGVTGSGKTFTMAHVIAALQRPAIILAHNKTLAAQLYGEFKTFFPNNSVEYFVSYYDYYLPESYVPRTDTYIAKESSINADIDRMRHAATRAVFERNDCIIVASVSCIYGIGSPEMYAQMVCDIKVGETVSPQHLAKSLTHLQYHRGDLNFTRGTFRIMGDRMDIFPVHYENRAWRLSFFGDEVESIEEIDPFTGERGVELKQVRVYPCSHYVTPGPTLTQAIAHIKKDLDIRLEELTGQGLLLEAERLRQRTVFDLEALASLGICNGIENYSRYLTGRHPGEPPPTLFEYIPDNAILFVDESHASIPQIKAMFHGDFSRKKTLSCHGFRLPSCIDNRPLRFEEWNMVRPQTIYVSATPGPWELEQTGGVFVEQVIRPTGLVDPECIVRPAENQVQDLLEECRATINANMRVLVITLTKKMAEYLANYMHERGLKVRYIHADTETLERIQILHDLRAGVFDILIGINLLREGLDVPECGCVAVLDADKEGFLRSSTSLIQIIGRAARNAQARVILYADTETRSMQQALNETQRRRLKQMLYNQEHRIVPQTIVKDLARLANHFQMELGAATGDKSKINLPAPLEGAPIKTLKKELKKAVRERRFEDASHLKKLIKRHEGVAADESK